MHIIGIDPGLTGGVAVLPDGLIFDTPTASGKKGSSKKVYLVAEMVSILRAQQPFMSNKGANLSGWTAHVYIESAAARPGQGVSSMFNFGRGYGLWEGIVAALGIPYTLVTPNTWKKEMGISGKDKGASRVRVGQLFAGLSCQLTRVKDHGRADALLIAAYGQRQQGEE